MPEAPEVENVIRQLQRELTGTTVKKATIRYEKLTSDIPACEFEMRIQGQRFNSFERVGKYLLFNMDTDQWISHLRMEGSYFLRKPDDLEEDKHIHAFFELEDGRILCYRDTRKFGRMHLIALKDLDANLKNHPVLGKLGLDVLDPSWNAEILLNLLQRRKAAIKTVLLDQKVIAGIGNIYANEILFDSRIHPLRPACTISLAECDKLIQSMQKITAQAIELKGTTIRTFSYDGDHTGNFQQYLMVHGQEKCRVCGHPIERLVINQRSAYLCPNCQSSSQ